MTKNADNAVVCRVRIKKARSVAARFSLCGQREALSA